MTSLGLFKDGGRLFGMYAASLVRNVLAIPMFNVFKTSGIFVTITIYYYKIIRIRQFIMLIMQIVILASCLNKCYIRVVQSFQ